MQYLVSEFRKLLLVVILVSAFSILGTLLATPAQAAYSIPATGVNLDGYAWSDTIGWISMNCKTGSATSSDICNTSSYRVTLKTDGTLSGYAWSSNVGWIKFDSLSGFPVSANTVAASSQANSGSTYPAVTFEGWARACAGTSSGNCSSMTSRTDGWDGWISLRNTGTYPHSIVTTAAGGTATSYAWGGDVVGWVSFDQIVYLAQSATISGTGCSNIPIGSSTCTGRVTWAISSAASPRITNTTITTTPAYTALTGTNQNITLRADVGGNVVAALDGTSQLNSVTLFATCVAGADFSNGVSCQPIVAAPPTVIIMPARSIIRSGTTSRISWTITGLADGSCALRGPGLTGTATTTSGSMSTSAIGNFTTIGITCTGSYGTVEDTNTIEVIPTTQEV